MSRYGVGTSTFVPDNFMLEGPIVKDSITVKNGTTLKRGQTFILENGLAVADTGVTPSLVYGLASEDISATTRDEKSIAYVSGIFSMGAVTFPVGKNYTHYKEALRNKGIILR
jgi:hypothetical protein